MEGKLYLSYRRTNEKKIIYHDVDRAAKQIGPTCNSKFCEKSSKRMCNTFSENDRLNIFTYFWTNLNWDEKQMYVSFLVKKIPVERRRSDASSSRRNHTYLYHLKLHGELVSVCKKMFLNTLNVGECQIHGWFIDKGEEKTASSQNSKPRKTKTNNNKFVSTFLESLPKMESDYCRKSTSKLYLEPIVQSHLQLYNMYTEKCKKEGKSLVSRTNFMNIFNEKKFSLFSPKKDQCDFVVTIKLET